MSANLAESWRSSGGVGFAVGAGMAPWNTTPFSAPPPAPAPPPSVMARVRASAWLPIALRLGAVAVALVVLAWIGRTAAARPTAAGSTEVGGRDSATSTERGGVGEAGAAPLGVAPLGGAPLGAGPLPAAPLAPPAAPSPLSPARAQASPADPVFINHASVDELRRLPGVGPKRAEAILVLRQRLGRFQRVEDLLRVKGVGRGAVKKWRPLVRLDAPGAESAEDGGLR